MTYNFGHSTSNVNQGHIIVRPDAKTSWWREIEHQQGAASAALQDNRMPAFDAEEGLFDIESDYDRAQRTRPMRLREFRYMCEAFELQGVKVKFEIKSDEIVLTMRGYKNTRQIHFSLVSLPFLSQAKELLTLTAAAVRNTP